MRQAVTVLAAIFGVVAYAASPGDGAPGRLPGWGHWRGTIKYTLVVTGRQEPFPSGNGGWVFNRQTSIVWTFTKRPPNADRYEVAKGPAALSFSRNDIGLPNPDSCNETSAKGSARSAFQTMLEFSGSHRTRRINFYLHNGAKAQPDYDLTYTYACAAAPPATFREKIDDVVPGALLVTPGAFAITNNLIRGKLEIVTRCGDWKNVLRGIACGRGDVDPFVTRRFTVVVDLVRVS